MQHFPCCQPFRHPRAIMRSLTGCRAADMDRLFWCSLLLNFLKLSGRIWIVVHLKERTCYLVASETKQSSRCSLTNLSGRGWNHYSSLFLLPEGCTNSESCLSQPAEVFWRKTGQSVDLPCTISSPCSGSRWQYEWLACKEQRCYQLKLHENPQKYQPNGASLHITTLQANDSGIYHCAAVSGQQQANQGCQHVGLGTTLMVRGRRDYQFIAKVCLRTKEAN